MKLKNFIFVTFFLAAASLGSALPSKNAKSPSVKIPATNSTLSATNSTLSATNSTLSATNSITQAIPATGSTSSPQVEQILLDAAGAGAGGDISKECLAAMLKIATSPEFLKCVPLTSITIIAPIVTDPTTIPKFLADPANVYKNVLEKPLTQFADGICAAPKCDDKAVAGAVQLLEDQCQKDLSNPFIQIVLAAAVFYSPTRDILCLKDQAKKDQYCWDETLLGVTQLPKSPFPITKIPLVDSIAVADPQAVCTSCPQQMIVGIFFKFVQDNQAAKDFLASQKIKLEELETAVAVKCGANFLSGKSN